MCIFLYSTMHTCLYLYIYLYRDEFLKIHVYIYINIWTYMYLYIYINLYLQVYMYLHTHTYCTLWCTPIFNDHWEHMISTHTAYHFGLTTWPWTEISGTKRNLWSFQRTLGGCLSCHVEVCGPSRDDISLEAQVIFTSLMCIKV